MPHGMFIRPCSRSVERTQLKTSLNLCVGGTTVRDLRVPRRAALRLCRAHAAPLHVCAALLHAIGFAGQAARGR